jgi:hypothetical protein
VTDAELAVSRLRTGWAEIRWVVRTLANYRLFRDAARQDEAIAHLVAAQHLIQGCADAINREWARDQIEGE